LILYLDTSSLIKLDLLEQGWPEVRALVTKATSVATSLVAYAEGRATLARAKRDRRLTAAELRTATASFEARWASYAVTDVTEALVRLAGGLAEKHFLRGLDSIHLASALTLQAELGEAITFSTADERQLAAAISEGLLPSYNSLSPALCSSHNGRMRMSELFGKTVRQDPAEAETPSHRLLLRTGMAAQIAAGVYAYLPLGWRVMKRIEEIIREEMDAAGGQEMLMPSLLPIEVYQASGRDKSMGDILFQVRDHRDRDFTLGPTHEEVFVDVFKRNVKSYRDLPLLVYQIAPKFRDEPRPRGGLIRLRQFIMKDLYSFDADWEGLDVSYQKMFDAYKRVFDRCGVPTVPVLADSGMMGGKDTHQFMYPTEYGEDTALLCPNCDYAADADVAVFAKEPAHADEEPKPVEEIDTPGLHTITALADHLGVPESKTCKAVFYTAALENGREPVFVAIRGDMDVNEAKLRNALGATDLHYMDEAEVEKAGFVAGSASAVGLKGVTTVADDLLPREYNLVAGANKADKHLLNVNYGRDWQADIVADVAIAKEGYTCAKCGTAMGLRRGIEMGQVFKLGTLYSEMMGATFLDSDGKQQPAIMGSYGIGIERLLAAVIEANHDEAGIVWPRNLAPFDVHIVAIQPDKPEVRDAAERLYDELTEAGVSALYDDRDETPGVKFNDADLLGMPLRVTVSPRNLQKDSLEVKGRTEAEARVIPLDGAVQETVALALVDKK
jgi:prolyl-tRNA synthetase